MIKKFSVPGWFYYHRTLADFLAYRKENPQYFYEDRIITSAYDYYPGLIWNGGRYGTADAPQYTMEEILNTYSQFPEIQLRHVFSNSYLQPEHVLDVECNQFLKKYVRDTDGIIIANKSLEKYLRTNYPQLELIYSTTLCIKDLELVNDITQNNIYVLNYAFNNDNDYLKQLTHPKNIEFLCADICVFDCPYRHYHYERTSSQILYGTPKFDCPFADERNWPYRDDPVDYVMNLPQAITNERVEELSEMGFENFKISGRENLPPMFLEFLIYYLVKPEYTERVRYHFLVRWW